MVKLFLDGGEFMWPILAIFIVGLAFVIERFWTLTRASVNTRKFLGRIRIALEEGGIAAATEECEKTPGPVASIFHAGLSRADKGLDHVEKAITTAGSLEMAFLERGMIVLSTVIVLAPLLGFTGTVWGMIQAFDAIEVAGDISPSLVANGIKVALITTVGGLVVAIILQFFYNYCVNKIDSIINDMEDASISLIDMLIKFNLKK